MKGTLLSLEEILLAVAIMMSITTHMCSLTHTLHDFAKHFLPKTLHNYSAWKVNLGCLINLLKTFNQDGFVAQLTKFSTHFTLVIIHNLKAAN